MKKLIILTLLFISMSIKAQVFITINPMQGHFNPGVLGNFSLDSKIGLYGNILYGSIKYNTTFGSFYTEQFKYGGGLSYKIDNSITVLCGFSNSIFNNTQSNASFNLDNYVNPSLNLGFFTPIDIHKKKVNILFITDVINWETQIGISIKLKKINHVNISILK